MGQRLHFWIWLGVMLAIAYFVVAGMPALAADNIQPSADLWTICHKPGTPAEHTIQISPFAWWAHQRHKFRGEVVKDYKGPCRGGDDDDDDGGGDDDDNPNPPNPPSPPGPPDPPEPPTPQPPPEPTDPVDYVTVPPGTGYEVCFLFSETHPGDIIRVVNLDRFKAGSCRATFFSPGETSTEETPVIVPAQKGGFLITDQEFDGFTQVECPFTASAVQYVVKRGDLALGLGVREAEVCVR